MLPPHLGKTGGIWGSALIPVSQDGRGVSMSPGGGGEGLETWWAAGDHPQAGPGSRISLPSSSFCHQQVPPVPRPLFFFPPRSRHSPFPGVSAIFIRRCP